MSNTRVGPESRGNMDMWARPIGSRAEIRERISPRGRAHAHMTMMCRMHSDSEASRERLGRSGGSPHTPALRPRGRLIPPGGWLTHARSAPLVMTGPETVQTRPGAQRASSDPAGGASGHGVSLAPPVHLPRAKRAPRPPRQTGVSLVPPNGAFAPRQTGTSPSRRRRGSLDPVKTRRDTSRSSLPP